jgi:hypothetical protein
MVEARRYHTMAASHRPSRRSATCPSRWRLRRGARESTFLCFATGSDGPRGLAFGPDGYLYSKVLPPAVAIGLLRG